MRDVARPGIAGTALEIRVAEVAADVGRDLSTHRIPGDQAACFVKIADVVAAVIVVARRGSVGEAAIARAGVATYRHGAGVVGASTVLVGQRHARTDQVPFGIAAVGVQGTDCIAA